MHNDEASKDETEAPGARYRRLLADNGPIDPGPAGDPHAVPVSVHGHAESN